MPFTTTHPSDRSERVEGEPFYSLVTYTLLKPNAEVVPALLNFAFQLRAFDVLPPCDAVGLLSGIDSTGLIVWSGALAFIEWLVQNPHCIQTRLRVAKRAKAHVIELGCGSGIVAVALCALLRSLRLADPNGQLPSSSTTVHVWATDGNPECVSLARKNLNEQCNAACVSCAAVTASTALLRWGDLPSVQEALQPCFHESAAASSITIIAADVLYDAAAVPLLVSTVSEIARMHHAGSNPSTPPGSLEWWLVYTPRSLTRAGNEAIFQALLDALAEHQWTFEVFDLPAGNVATGFEHHPDCAVPALLGCILVVQVTSDAAR
ncbi:hypothetical protein LPMP_121040 [Leishmania panamensis]|uniref:SAM-dependent methyltransferase, putative n=1 Tax=Leishmania panamensis TaxID=5679 RepID=A0A088S4L5_LEIPA|nr:hypothetical protein LPMP_121040 [Leishmania panamensis]AIN96431.1 hypothetical protein LPMP_121040 [Leishmania panamensis]